MKDAEPESEIEVVGEIVGETTIDEDDNNDEDSGIPVPMDDQKKPSFSVEVPLHTTRETGRFMFNFLRLIVKLPKLFLSQASPNKGELVNESMIVRIFKNTFR